MRLIVNIDGEKPRTVNIADEAFTIGRSPKNSLQIESDSVSRAHLSVRCANGAIYVTDLGSANGTFINNEKLKPDQEVAWHTFFPISFGEKVTLAFEAVSNETIESEKKSTIRSTDKKNTTQTKLEKAKAKPEIKEKQGSGKRTLAISIAVMVGMGYFFYNYYKDKEFKETDLSHTPKKPDKTEAPKGSLELVQVPTTLKDNPKCQNEKEILFCNILKTNHAYSEGAIQKDNDLFVYMNFGLRLKNVEIDPSFSMASDQDRMTYLMTYLAFREDIRSAITQTGFSNLMIVDISSDPSRVNQVMKVSQSNLMKLSNIDVQTFFGGVINKDPSFFNSLLLPLIEMGYAK